MNLMWRRHKGNQAKMWPEVVDALSDLRYDPQATRSYELLSGAYFWTDEVPAVDNVPNELDMEILLHMKVIFLYRASLIMGVPDRQFQHKWDYLQRRCPSWPGFRQERQSQSLRAELEKDVESSTKEVERALKVCERANRIAEIRDKKIKVN